MKEGAGYSESDSDKEDFCDDDGNSEWF